MEAAGRAGSQAGPRQAKRSSDDARPDKCPACMTFYGGRGQRPHSLPCGHTVCTPCINKRKRQNCVACPECCVTHAVPKEGQFPINFAIEAFTRKRWKAAAAAIEAFTGKRWKAAAASPPASVGEGAGGMTGGARLSKYMSSVLKEHASKVEAAITACEVRQSQLGQYRTTLAGCGRRQQQLEDRLWVLVTQSRSARDLLHQEESRAEAKEEELQEEQQGLQAVLEKLRATKTDQAVGAAVSEAVRYTGKAAKKVAECQGFPDAGTVTTLKEVEEASSAALEGVQSTLETLATEEPRPQADPDSTVLGRMLFVWTGSLVVKDLRSLAQPARRLLEAGLVFAVQVEGQRRHARLSLEAGKLYVHALTDQPLPRGAATLPLSELVPPCPRYKVFLDLSWPGSAPRRVEIRLSSETPQGRHLLLLCTGQRGPSYVNTRLHSVWRKGEAGEYVKGGHFMSNDGHWTSAMLPGLGEGQAETWKPVHAGDVFVRRSSGDHRSGLFGIFTSDHLSNGLRSHSLCGKVVDGLQVVADAVQHSDITEVTVVACGVVLPTTTTPTTTATWWSS